MLELQILYVLDFVVGIKHENGGFHVNFIRDVITKCKFLAIKLIFTLITLCR